MSLRERIEALTRGELAGLIAVVALTVVGAGLWYVRSLPRPVEIGPAGPAGGAGTMGVTAASVTPSPAVVVVDVAGWVRRPGVYEFDEGDRVIDAIERAGGPRRRAELTALNLAAPLVDGSQVLVPRVGSGGESTGSGGAPSPGTTLINVNSASAAELEVLPGIGEVLAAAIVEYRTENGPFAAVDELEAVSGIGPSTLEEIRDLITV
jgi:competence protein ComEA